MKTGGLPPPKKSLHPVGGKKYWKIQLWWTIVSCTRNSSVPKRKRTNHKDLMNYFLGPHQLFYTHTYTHIYIYTHTHTYIYIYISSSSCRAASTDLPDPLSPPVSIVHCSWEVFKATSCIGTELLYIRSSWSSGPCSYMWRGLWEYVAYDFVLTSPAVSHMSDSPNLDSFRDGWLVVV